MRIGERIILEDVERKTSSEQVWSISTNSPSIKQIYGTFFPPYHMKYFEQFVKHVHSNPHAHHDTNGYIQSKVESMNINQRQFNEFLDLCDRIQSQTGIRLGKGTKIRKETEGAVVWTSYHNGFFVNEKGIEILELCKDSCKLQKIAEKTGTDMEGLKPYIIRLVAFGIVDAEA